MKKIIRIFKWLFSRWMVKDVVYVSPQRKQQRRPYIPNTPKNIVERKRKRVHRVTFNPGVRIMTHNERILYKHYPNLQKWYNHFNGAIPDKLPVLNFRPK